MLHELAYVVIRRQRLGVAWAAPLRPHERGTRTDKAGGQRAQRLAIHGTNLVRRHPVLPSLTLAKAFCGLLTVLSGYGAQYKNCSQGGC